MLRKSYAVEMAGAGFLRPWMLAWCPDHGVSGLMDPEVTELLMQLILTEGSLGLIIIRSHQHDEVNAHDIIVR